MNEHISKWGYCPKCANNVPHQRNVIDLPQVTPKLDMVVNAIGGSIIGLLRIGPWRCTNCLATRMLIKPTRSKAKDFIAPAEVNKQSEAGSMDLEIPELKVKTVLETALEDRDSKKSQSDEFVGDQASDERRPLPLNGSSQNTDPLKISPEENIVAVPVIEASQPMDLGIPDFGPSSVPVMRDNSPPPEHPATVNLQLDTVKPEDLSDDEERDEGDAKECNTVEAEKPEVDMSVSTSRDEVQENSSALQFSEQYRDAVVEKLLTQGEGFTSILKSENIDEAELVAWIADRFARMQEKIRDLEQQAIGNDSSILQSLAAQPHEFDSIPSNS